MVSFYSLLIIAICNKLCTAFEYFLHNASGKVEKGNFLYYGMSYEGTILLELTSISGDCDLYVSQNNMKPSYELNSNCLQSATCGIDSVIIPKSFKRPVGIGIFGYPSHDVCDFNLVFYRTHDSRDIFNFDPYHESFETDLNQKLEEVGVNSKMSEPEEESLFWVFLRSAIVFLIEII